MKILLHIRCIHINNLWSINPDIIRKGYVYICLTPKYRSIINGKNVFFQDDEELSEYRYNMIKNDIKIKDNNKILKRIIEDQDLFLEYMKKIITKYSVHEDILDAILYDPTELDNLYDIFDYDKKTGRMQGFYENQWHDFKLKDIINDVNNIMDSFKLPRSFICTIKNEEKEETVYSLLKYIIKNYKLKLFYLKGLGENDPEEFKEFMRPGTERLIQIKCDSEEELQETLKTFFSSKSEPRKEFVMKELGE